MRNFQQNRLLLQLPVVVLVLVLGGCSKPAAPPAAGGPQAMPVQTLTVHAAPVAQSDEYVATIKSRRSATLNPQVEGNLTRILVHSGDHVRAGQVLMQIDPIKQEATVQTQASTEQQKLALYQYNQLQNERQHKLFEAGVISRDALDQADQAFKNSKADYESAGASRKSEERQLSYYRVSAPFDGIVGDVPVHVGDYVAPTTMLTTIDENKDLEAYIYIPTERGSQVRNGLGVDILDSSENLIEHTTIDFISPQVDNQLQGILAKANVHSTSALLRSSQLIKARVIWNTKSTPVVPVLAVSRLGGQTFVFVAQNVDGKTIAKQRAIQVGDTVGNNYAVPTGLAEGDRVIVSGTQLLADGMPVAPMG
ncbi:MAG TPA: efflux RND transporter periplasmic adaptor subunit [Acidisarcina sp.]